MTPDF